jgi:2-amino-4-hydroxy-6-hydroxymethyldihydropteridine diphosphokinase
VSDPSSRVIQAVIGLGSNIGDKVAHIEDAISRLTADGRVRAVKRSRLYKTAPWGLTDQDWFVNACLLVETDVSARGLLERCLGVERTLGRVRDVRWGPRVIDLDILVYDQDTIEIAKRAFVLVPLVEVAPDSQIDGKAAVALLAGLHTSDVVPL